MVPIAAQKPDVEHGGYSLVSNTPKYKRRKVSAIRDFPPGCGPNAQRIDSGVNQTTAEGDNVENVKECGDRASIDDEKLPVSVRIPPCSNDIEEVAGPGLMKNGYAGDSKLLESPKSRSDELLGESNIGRLRSPESLLVKETVPGTKELVYVSEELSKKEFIELKEQVFDSVAAMDKEIGINDKVACLSSHYPILSNFVWKEKNYPPRRRVSGIRDFPPGCGMKVPVSSDDKCTQGLSPVGERHVNRDEIHDENCNDAIMAVLNEIQLQAPDDVSCDMTSERGRDCAEARAESGKDKLPQTAQRSGKPGHPSKGKEELKHSEIGQDVREILRYDWEYNEKNNDGGVAKDVITYKKVKGVKRRAVFPSESYMELYKENSVSSESDDESLVVVQGLPAAKTWRRAVFAVKSVPCYGSAKGSRRKEDSVIKGDRLTSAFLEESKVAEKSKINLMREKLPLAEESSSEAGVPVVQDKRGSAESDKLEKINDLQLVARPKAHEIDLVPFGASSSGDRGARSKVRETLRLFHAVLRKLMQEEETKTREKRSLKGRIDQHAAKLLKDKGKYVNTGKSIIGIVPGVEVGDEFHYRVELMIVGLHRQSQGGIDYLREGNKVLATSIVASGGYDNDLDNSDLLIYTGQGGNLSGGDKEPEDQKLERGNLALKNSVDERNHVRVIRGYKETDKGKISTTYTYDGLYTVDRYWEDRSGPHGKMIYKFELRRVHGQAELAWKEVKKSKKLKERKGLCVEDISQGKEKFPIGAVNTVDNEKPPPFTYITHMMYPDWCKPILPRGCSCRGRCSDSSGCACAEKNKGEIPYNHDGAIVEAKSLVYECGPSCKCPPSCYNRVSQHGIKFPLEVFKTENRGWGVRSLSSIPSGSFICEYMGELLEDKEAEQRTGNDEYLFDIGHNYNDQSVKEELSGLMPDSLQSSSEVVADVGFTIDAAQNANVGRFINHSCSPNLYAQNVLYDYDDTRIPHIMLFAAENIPPLQELTYHYNYVIGQVRDKEGNVKIKNCYCGASDCTGRMY